MKKIIAIILALLMTIVSAGCAGNNAANDSNINTQTVTQAVDPKSVHHKIGVVEIATGNAVAITEQYFSEYLAPYYNCEFVFSEACSTTDAVITFMENCADMGVEAIICNYNYDTEQLTQKAADLGMYFCENLNRNATSEAAYTGGYDNFCGTFAANQSSVAKLFHDWIVDTLDTSEDHGFIVTSGWAYRGNEQHLKITEAMLNALQEVYGLTFDDEIETYLASSAPMHATNDKNVEIYIYPDSFLADGWVQGFSSELQTGKYDYVLAAMAVVGYCNVAIDEVERAYNRNITVASFAGLGESLTASFETMDAFGNKSIDFASVKYNTLVSAMSFIQVYNALMGYYECLLDENGEVQELTFSMSGVSSLEDLEIMNHWDQGDGSGKWVGHTQFIDSCLGMNNPDLTGEQIQANVATMVYDNIKDVLEQ